MWSNVVFPADAKVPSSRSKHASVLHGQFLYMLGGRNGNVPLKDFWRYCISDNTWDQLEGNGDFPGCLQEHTMVGYRDTLYVFGGEVGFSNGVETPLWMYSISKNEWRKFRAPKGVGTPKGRRSHTATVFQDSMYIYGGYQDLKGSTTELWAFHFASETWHLVSQGGAFDCPPPRHRHSAVLHDNAMWIFGGMMDLQERSDFWRFDFVSRRWRPVKSKPGPGCLHSHCAVKFLSVMMIFGGEREGQTLSEVWRFHFATEFWERLNLVTSSKPMPRAQTTAFIFSQFTTRGAIHYMGLPEQDYFGSQPEVGRQPITIIPSSTLPQRKKYDFKSSKDEEDIYEEIDDLPKKSTSGGKDNRGMYKFSASNTSCVMDDDDDSAILLNGAGAGAGRRDRDRESNSASIYEQLPRELLRDLRRPQHFQRLGDDAESLASNSKAIMLKDLAKMSQLNLSRLSNYCGYSVFSNDSTESLDTSSVVGSSVNESPISVRRVLRKSRSGNLICEEPVTNNGASGLTRDPLSVPDFQLQTLSLEDENQYENSLESHPGSDSKKSPSASGSGPKRSDSDYTFQSYDCSSRSSTLSSGNNQNGSGFSNYCPSSGCNTLSDGIKLIELDEEEEDAASTTAYFSSDEFSSLSGYESIETGINNINSVFYRNRPAASKEIEFVQKITDLSRVDCLKNNGKMSFANPHYLCPEVETIVEKRQSGISNIFSENMAAIVKDADDSQHINFAQALNSPADSLFSDYQDFQSRLSNDLLEMSNFCQPSSKAGHPLPPLPGESRPKSVVVLESSTTLGQSDSSVRMRQNINNTSERSNVGLLSCTGTPMPGRKKVRPVSAGGRVEMLKPDGNDETNQIDVGSGENKNQLQLLMYIVGGREVGQDTDSKSMTFLKGLIHKNVYHNYISYGKLMITSPSSGVRYPCGSSTSLEPFELRMSGSTGSGPRHLRLETSLSANIRL